MSDVCHFLDLCFQMFACYSLVFFPLLLARPLGGFDPASTIPFLGNVRARGEKSIGH